MSLTRYYQKRDFARTTEPKGKPAPRKKGQLTFVIQKHAASHLHYDFRLEMEGVLKSWAVPKGLPRRKGDRRLAMEVEDHPLDYGGFEGTIPEGNYGAGTVMLWDRGTYEVLGGDPLRAHEKGKIHFVLHGKKLQGEWTLVRMRPRNDGDKRAWLLLKSGEDLKGEVKETSVLTGKTMEQIASGRGRVWQSNRGNGNGAGAEESQPGPERSRRLRAVSTSSPTRPGDKKTRTSSLSGAATKARPAQERQKAVPAELAAQLKGLPRSKAKYIEPMKALLVDKNPEDPGWLFEIKWDGYRAVAVKQNGKVKMFSRRAKEVTADFTDIAAAVASLPGKNSVIDGEIVALDESGHASFQRLQNFRHKTNTGEPPNLHYYVFDLINLENRDLRDLPLGQRKSMLQALLQDSADPIRFSASLQGKPAVLLAQARKNRVEGLIAKRASSVYEPDRRSGAWVKVKIALEQEFVIGGYTEPRRSRPYFGALLVGYYQDGNLGYASKTGTGFDHEMLKTLHEQFQPLVIDKCPFVNLPSRHPESEGLGPAEMRRCTWLQPKLVCEIRFTEWTDHGGLRHPVFLGLRDDKSPQEVVREKPVHLDGMERKT